METKHDILVQNKRVLFISGGDYKYGAPKSMMTMILTLRELYNIEPIVMTKKENELNDICTRLGIENYSFWYRDIMAGSPYTNILLTCAKHFVKYLGYLYGGLIQKRICQIGLDFSKIDIIHTNLNRVDIGAYLAQKYHKPHIWHIREMGQEDYNVIFYKKKCISYMNEHTTRFLAISDVVKKKWIRMGIDSKKILTVYDGLETDEIKKRKNRTNNILKIIITGHIQPNKGQLQIVEAISKISADKRQKIQLDIVGEAYSDYKNKIVNSIKKNHLEDIVHFTGYQTGIYKKLCNYDIGITASKAEGFGRCTVEYMMAGLLTIASDTGANPEIIQNGETGILYHYGDSSDLAKKIEWCIDNREECTKIAQRGCDFSRETYSDIRNAENVYRLYQEILN